MSWARRQKSSTFRAEVVAFSQENEPRDYEEERMFDPHALESSQSGCFRVFAKKKAMRRLPERAPDEGGDNGGTTVFTDGSCLDQGTTKARAGSGVWFGDGDRRNRSLRVPRDHQTNQIAELYAALIAIQAADRDEKLTLVTDSMFVVDGLTKNLNRWEETGWIGVSHSNFFKCTVAWLRNRRKPTVLRWVKGHIGIEGNEGADMLAGAGAEIPRGPDKMDLRRPPGLMQTGAQLNKVSQRLLYKGIRSRKTKAKRNGTARNLLRIQEEVSGTFGTEPEDAAIWRLMRSKDISRNIRDFLWKATHNALKVGDFWRNIPGYDDRATCQVCGETDTMEHILTECEAPGREIDWRLATALWNKKYEGDITPGIGGILGCGLSNFALEGKPRKGKNRLYRIIISESAFLVWKMRCERQIGGRRHSDTEIHNKWVGP